MFFTISSNYNFILMYYFHLNVLLRMYIKINIDMCNFRLTKNNIFYYEFQVRAISDANAYLHLIFIHK